jgi:hypothetical protein
VNGERGTPKAKAVDVDDHEHVNRRRLQQRVDDNRPAESKPLDSISPITDIANPERETGNGEPFFFFP